MGERGGGGGGVLALDIDEFSPCMQTICGINMGDAAV